jgi:phosphotransferase system  glucose/maltose/N-acetylglucosamine-specific IIC component
MFCSESIFFGNIFSYNVVLITSKNLSKKSLFLHSYISYLVVIVYFIFLFLHIYILKKKKKRKEEKKKKKKKRRKSEKE